MKVVEPSLRLSAQRALRGAIHPEIRAIKISRDGLVIHFTTFVAAPLSEAAEEALSTAAAEIIADFSDSLIEESVIISAGPLPADDVMAEGWVYQRAEAKETNR